MGLSAALADCGGTSSTRTVTAISSPAATTTTGRMPSTTTRTVTRAATTSTPGGSAAATTKCSPTDLGIHFVGTSGAAGSLFSAFEFINVSARACHLYGYPGMAAFARTGQRLALSLRRDPTHAPHNVLLAPRRGSEFTVRTLSNAAGPCVTAGRLRFTPPNDYSSLEIAHRLSICGAQATLTAVRSRGQG